MLQNPSAALPHLDHVSHHEVVRELPVAKHQAVVGGRVPAVVAQPQLDVADGLAGHHLRT